MTHNNEYIISQFENPINSDWLSIKLPNGYFLSYDPTLRVTHNADCSAVLLGRAWQVVNGLSSPYELVEKLEDCDIDTIICMEKTWCGRYLLIVGDYLFTDMSATLSVFYGQGLVSNSLYNITYLLKYPYKDPGTIWGVDYIPGILTQYEDIFRLIPEQYLNYVTCQTKTRPLLPEGILSFHNDAERLQAFIDSYSFSLKLLHNEFKNSHIVLPLTGGVDSRTNFSFLTNIGIPFSAITYAYPNISHGDEILPCQVCEKKGIDYNYVVPKKCDKKTKKRRLDEFRLFTMGLDGDISSKYCYEHRLYEQLQKDHTEKILVLGGAGWEILVSWYYIIGQFKEESINSISEIEAAFPDLKLKSNCLKHKAASSWLEFIKKNPTNLIVNDVNRFFWDLREGVWLSNDRSYDMYENIQLVQPFNCRHFLSILYGYNKPERMKKMHQKVLIKRLCPEVSSIPFSGDIDSNMPTIRKKIRRVRNRIKRESVVLPYAIKNHGLVETVRYYIVKLTSN